MIVTFSVSNFRSFLGRETLSLVPSETVPSNDGHVVVPTKQAPGMLRTSVVYGANGAGKSNLFKAFKCLRGLAIGTMDAIRETPMQPFAFEDSREAGTNTVFDLQFATNGSFYRYLIELSDNGIDSEELSKRIGAELETVYLWTAGKEPGRFMFSFGTGFSGKPSKRLKALAVLGAPPRKSFLSSVAANMDDAEMGLDLANALRWFKTLWLISPQDRLDSLVRTYRNDQLRDFASNLLEAASGIDRLVLNETKIDESTLRSLMQPEPAERTIRALSSGDKSSVLRNRNSGAEIQLEKNEDNTYEKIELKAEHALGNGRTGVLDISEESDGTKRLAELIPALYALVHQNHVCVIDEIERSLHPLLCRAFLKLFLRTGAAGQLILMTHADGLLDDSVLRRDEVWFVEKDPESKSHLYSLNEFRERHKATLRQYYFQGRYGAIPSGFKMPPGESAQERGWKTE